MSDLIPKLRLKPDDKELWAKMYVAFRPRIYFFLFKLCAGDSSLAEDLCQETFLRFLRYSAISRVETDEAALAYLRVIARNLFLKNMRATRAKRWESISDVPEEEIEHALMASVPQAEMKREIRALVEQLSPQEGKLLSLILTGLPLSEISQELGVSYGNAAVKVYRLRRKLRKLMNRGV